MRRVLKKQDRNDFNSRIKRLDPAFAATPSKARSDRQPWELEKRTGRKAESPILMTGLGFVLAITALYAANNPDAVQAMLINTGWPVQFLQYGTTGISVLIIALIIFYLVNMLRIVTPKTTGRWNSAGLVVGAIAAVASVNMDPAVFQTGFQYAGIEGPQDIMAFLSSQGEDFAEVDWSSVVMVSSSAK